MEGASEDDQIASFVYEGVYGIVTVAESTVEFYDDYFFGVEVQCRPETINI